MFATLLPRPDPVQLTRKRDTNMHTHKRNLYHEMLHTFAPRHALTFYHEPAAATVVLTACVLTFAFYWFCSKFRCLPDQVRQTTLYSFEHKNRLILEHFAKRIFKFYS